MILNGMILYGHSHYKDDISHMFKPVIQKILIYHYQDVSLADRSNGLIRTISADRKYDIQYVTYCIWYTVYPEFENKIILPRDAKMFQVICAALIQAATTSDKNI